VQDLPHGGWRDRHAEFRQFAVDPAVSCPARIFGWPSDLRFGCGRGVRPGAIQVLFTLVYVIVRSVSACWSCCSAVICPKTLSCWFCATRMRYCAARSHTCGTSRLIGRGWPRCPG
jgi:hypothetical protein